MYHTSGDGASVARAREGNGMARNDALQRIKRFYSKAEAAPAQDGFAIHLDGRAAKTPQGAPLILPTAAVADLVAAEWAGQGDWIEFTAMPASRHAFTAIDRVALARYETAAELARFAGSDLLCYFAEEPVALIARQNSAWGPLLDWAQADLGLTFIRATGVVHQAQPPETISRAEALAEELDDFALAGLAWGAALLGSAVLAFAVQRGRIGGEEAFDLSRLDETFQEEHWGADAEASERAERLKGEAILLDRWFRALAA
jgi:chaperone required for assembly of F1-ATPase